MITSPALTALRFAGRAALDTVTTRWDSQVLGDNELPPELRTEERFLLIFLLPRLLKLQGATLAHNCAMRWQYGQGPGREFKVIAVKGRKPIKYWTFKLSQIGKSVTLMSAIDEVLLEAVKAIEELAAPTAAKSARWEKLFTLASQLAKDNKKPAWTKAVGDYRTQMDHPSYPILIRNVSDEDYIEHQEHPLQSDAFKAIGKCAIRAYLHGQLIKRDGSPDIKFKPERVGVRIWDDYDFVDGALSDWSSIKNLRAGESLGFLLTGRYSQPLGRWQQKGKDPYILQNADFADYRNLFRPKYNEWLNKRSGNHKKDDGYLVCEDYSSVSEFKEFLIKTGAEYKLI
ncbi:hypothetical protein [Bradyrhizobium sp. sGM-13]|uniref:hypothetical protein n=1 Tax=Bradyrhizobium sp. sGM-13 TaxID=2831781 RepID=UPI001BD07F02|nr:hypothetical protein [Bradyrhizobium sp. sGM-13]